ncbi:MAG: thioredoxin family protein [Muribaculaceae bacterium]|nr:thioredoxin family protein [Muribaculaceae bacterium]
MKSWITVFCAIAMIVLCACNEKKTTPTSASASASAPVQVSASVEAASTETETPVADAKLTVIDFYATWCGPCKAMAPIVEKMKKKYPNVVFKKVDIDQDQELAMQYQVDAVPTFVFKTDKGEERMVGACSEAEFEEAIKKALQ